MSRQQHLFETFHIHLQPIHLMVEDETHHHHVPKGSESHFKVTIVSTAFKGISRIARHRLVNQWVKDEFSKGLHALSLHLYAPEEWTKEAPPSPKCRGGSQK